MEQSAKIKITGNIRIEHSSGKTWESGNFVVNQGVEWATEILSGQKTGSIYRMMIGDGGYSGGSRVLPVDSWRLKTDLVSPGYSWDIASTTVTHSGTTSSIYMVCVFEGSHHTLVPTMFSEAGLIIGRGSAGVLETPAHLGANDRLFAYRTFDELSLPSGDPAATITIHWTILLENG